MKKTLILLFLVCFLVVGLSGSSGAKEGKVPKVGPVKLNPHPASLEGKTVLLRWNGKFNGDKYLNRVGELLTQQVKKVKIIKLWEMDRDTAVISDGLEKSERLAAKIAEQKPAIVIAAQGD